MTFGHTDGTFVKNGVDDGDDLFCSLLLSMVKDALLDSNAWT